MIGFAIADKKDLPAILEVMKDTGYSHFLHKKTDEEMVKVLEDHFPTKTYIVAFVKNPLSKPKIIAYSIIGPVSEWDTHGPVKPRKDFLFGMGLGVHSKFHRQGIAYELKKRTESAVRSQGKKGLYVEVSSKNHASIMLQEKSGYKEIARFHDGHRPPGVLNVVFVKEL